MQSIPEKISKVRNAADFSVKTDCGITYYRKLYGRYYKATVYFDNNLNKKIQYSQTSESEYMTFAKSH